MPEVRLLGVVIKNFRSFKDEEIAITPAVGLKYLGGDNQLEPRLGANGAGKSSLWEAIVWCLYGRSIRGARTSQVISWGEAEVMVGVILDIGGVETMIVRYGPPERMEIQITGGEPVPATQANIDTTVGLSLDRFLHSVIFGQGKKLFPDLSITERGELFDEVLDLDLWTRCGDATATEAKRLGLVLGSHRMELGRINGVLAGLPTDESLQEKSCTWEAEKESSLQAIDRSIKAWEVQHLADIDVAKDNVTVWAFAQDGIIQNLKKQVAEWEAEHDAALESLGAELEVLESKVLALSSLEQTQLDPYVSNTARQALWNKRTSYNTSKEMEARKWQQCNQAVQALATWSDTKTCHVCGSVVPIAQSAEMKSQLEQAKEKFQNELNLLIAENEQAAADILVLEADYNEKAVAFGVLQEKVKQATKDLKEATDAVTAKSNTITAHIEKVNPHVAQLDLAERTINPYIAQLDALKNKTNPHLPSLETTRNSVNPFIHMLEQNKVKRAEIELLKQACESDITFVEGQVAAVEFWRTGFKRIRLYFVEQILAALQIEIQSAISALGLNGWKVLLATETENKSGTMKLGVQIRIRSAAGQEGAWETWSGGESQRLRLSMGMGLAALIQRAAGVRFDIEVWDEPSAWLSDVGIEDLLEALRYRASVNKKQVWIVDHRALAFSGFSEIWSVKKGEEGSKLHKVSEARE